MIDYREYFEQLPSDRVLIEGETWSLDYKSFFAQASRALEQIDPLELKPGARVGIYANNSLSYLILLWALWSRGMVAVLMNRRWPKAQASELMTRLRCQAVFVDPAVEWDVSNQNMPVCQMPPVVHGSVPAGAIRDTETLPMPDFSSPATVMFTTGSTGTPKAVEHRLESHLLNASGSLENLAFGVGDAWLLSLALYHVGGLSVFFRALIGGGALHLCVRPEPVLREKKGITHISAVPTQLSRWIREPDIAARLKSAKAILLGGAAPPASLIGECTSLDLPLYTTYGSTEMASQITTTSRLDSTEHWYTAGRCLPHRKIKIDGARRIFVGGPVLFSRLLGLESENHVVEAPEWYCTGDLGEINEAGYLRILGREDNMFTSGGENISPEEVESAIMKLPGVAQALVVPVNDEEFIQRPAAFIKWSKGEQPDLKTLCLRLGQYIARYKIPDYCLPWPEEPPMRGGKLNRAGFHVLAERLIEAGG